MKFKCILALLLYTVLSCDVFSYTSLTPIFDSEVTTKQENRNGLFVKQSAETSYNPFSFGANTRLYYRFVLFDPPIPETNTKISNNTTNNNSGIIPSVPEGEFVTNSMESDINLIVGDTNTNVTMLKKFTDYSLINTRLDIGIENHFSQANDMLGAYVYFAPVSFFSIKLAGYSTFWYNTIKFGYIGYDNIKDIKYNKSDIRDSTNSKNAIGYMFQVIPAIHFKLSAFIFQNTTTFTYEKVGKKPYYLNNRTFRPHKKEGFDIKNDTYLMGNTHPFYVGIYYGFKYIFSTDKMDHMFGLAAVTHFSFLEDKLFLDIGLSSGMHLSLENYQNSIFIETQILFRYKIL